MAESDKAAEILAQLGEVTPEMRALWARVEQDPEVVAARAVVDKADAWDGDPLAIDTSPEGGPSPEQARSAYFAVIERVGARLRAEEGGE